ncbi:unnamed protein product [Nyctereutes procyonoides]|uniref:SOSS complex subunit C n=1 Tax=Nyctereutes procyonoides TaxID=34880 RepID=A0A811YRC6_NYCPR|nr:unnamed protein product [Nyctereutes procyonoides]
MSANPSRQGFQNKNRVAILAELDNEGRKLLIPTLPVPLSFSHLCSCVHMLPCSLSLFGKKKGLPGHAEQQHIAAQQKIALQHARAHSFGCFTTQDSAFGNHILPILPHLDLE